MPEPRHRLLLPLDPHLLKRFLRLTSEPATHRLGAWLFKPTTALDGRRELSYHKHEQWTGPDGYPLLAEFLTREVEDEVRTFVRGRILHDSHPPLDLPGWHRAIWVG